MFGRATIRLGIGPHSSSVLFYFTSLFYLSFVHTNFIIIVLRIFKESSKKYTSVDINSLEC